MTKKDGLKLLNSSLINLREFARQLAEKNNENDIELFANRYRSNLSKKIRSKTLKLESKEVEDLCNLLS